MRRSLLLLPLLSAAAAACARDRGPRGQNVPADTLAHPQPRPAETRIYERRIAFLAAVRDSTILIPIFFTARTGADRVDREIKGWLARGGTWDAFLDAAWHTPPTRAPWRILPHRSLRLVVGLDDALERIRYREGVRDLEITFGTPLAEWTGQRGEWYRAHRASARVAKQPFSGTLVDMTRARAEHDPPPGDWIFLIAGDTLQLLLEDPNPSQRSDSTYRAWARLRGDDYQWPNVRVTWSRTRAFERARRDVPAAWTFLSEDQALAGTIEARSSDLVALQSTAAQLPVQGLYEVRGNVRIGDLRTDVIGLVRHLQY